MSKFNFIQRGNGYEVNAGRLNNAHGFLDENNTLYITNVTIASKQRGAGLGQRLVRELIRRVKPKKVLAVYIVPESAGFWKKMRIEEGRDQFYANKKLASERKKYIKKYL